ncbi:hypothetical protein CgunFtcFv8_004446 [Champsocephalus gunnari]|uniref:Uncharacterized protein n=1 Tax=Champsocephalus gunnari TaxID=52237 RepID=A0AAN8HYT7_CHAGU|nr:hypothetical protein CgunFtcFv8_004446 [Champsocephalus gunnari]
MSQSIEGPVILELTCGRVIAVWAREEAGCGGGLLGLLSSHLSVTHHWTNAPPAPLTPAPWTFRPTVEDDNQGERWGAREGAAGCGGPGSVASIHPSTLAGPFLLICLDGCPLSGAQHDERPAAVSAFHVSI